MLGLSVEGWPLSWAGALLACGWHFFCSFKDLPLALSLASFETATASFFMAVALPLLTAEVDSTTTSLGQTFAVLQALDCGGLAVGLALVFPLIFIDYEICHFLK